MARTFAPSYLARDGSACAFFPHDFRDRDARVARARAAARRTIDPALATVLREQQAALPPSPARQANLDALCGGNTAVVVSGQQVGLFLGPLYTFYKAASAIAAARAIQAEAGVRCVPLFWLQTEDHDFAEIARTTVADGEGRPVTLTLPPETEADARCSVAHRTLAPEITPLLEALAGSLAGTPGGEAVVALLRTHYVPGRPLASAFAGALAAIFAEEGLLFLNPRDPRIAPLAAPLYRSSLERADAIDECLAAQGARLESAGFTQQIPLRPGSTLVFFHRDNAHGPRYRLQRSGDDWVLTGSQESVPHAEVMALTAREPMRFSTSALLRPLVQDMLLPTVAYVGGPAEVSYFAQLMPLYRLLDVTPPLVMPRARFRCVDARARRLLAALKLSPDDLGRPADELLARIAVQRPPDAVDPAALKNIVDDELAPRVAALTAAVELALPHLARAAERTHGSVMHALQKLTGRYARALLERDTTTRDRLQRLHDRLLPGGVPQERVYGWPWLAAQLGPEALKGLVFDEMTRHGTFVTDLLELRP